MVPDSSYDVVIIGGGPAGCTAAAVLAMHGRRVIVLEKEKFPRYHVGESMMPYCYFPLERIGALDRVKNSHFIRKYSVQFVRQNGEVTQPFYFFQHYDHPSSTTWQILRSEFDQILMDNAREKGAEVLEETKVNEILWDGDRALGVRAVRKDGTELELRAPMTIDASGRDALTIARRGWRVMDEKLRKIAIWTYYRGARRDSGYDEGATTVAYVPQKGWFWYIPLHEDVVSVGIVAERDYLFKGTRDLRTIFEREIRKNKWIEEHLAQGEQFGKYFTTSEFSYRSRYCAADGLVLAGDAFGFLDPVFSSGLFLALWGGVKVGDVVHAALNEGEVRAERFAEYGSEVCESMETMRKLVYAFYDRGFSFKKLITAYPDVRPALTDCLIGHLQRDFGDLVKGLGEFATLPEPTTYGHPLTEPLCASSS